MSAPIRLKDHEVDTRLIRGRLLVGAVAVILLTLLLV